MLFNTINDLTFHQFIHDVHLFQPLSTAFSYFNNSSSTVRYLFYCHLEMTFADLFNLFFRYFKHLSFTLNAS